MWPSTSKPCKQRVLAVYAETVGLKTVNCHIIGLLATRSRVSAAGTKTRLHAKRDGLGLTLPAAANGLPLHLSGRGAGKMRTAKAIAMYAFEMIAKRKEDVTKGNGAVAQIGSLRVGASERWHHNHSSCCSIDCHG